MNTSAISILDNRNGNSSVNFGMLYSPKTIKSLKKIVPELIRREGFGSTRIAIANLKQLGQRKDNIMLHLVPEDSCYLIEAGVNRVKNRKFDGFIYGVKTPTCIEIASRSRTGFQDFTKTLATDAFVEATHTRIDEYATLMKNETLKDKIARKTKEAKEFIVDTVDWVKEELSLIDGTTHPDGTKSKSTIVAWHDFKEYIRNSYNDAKISTYSEIVFLRREIDSLPTKIK